MLPPEPPVLVARQAFADAQASMLGAKRTIGYYQVGWYGSDTDDERGCFAIVDPAGPLASNIGDYLNIQYGSREVYVYCIGSQNTLLTDVAVTRRAYQALCLLAFEPIRAKVSVVS